MTVVVKRALWFGQRLCTEQKYRVGVEGDRIHEESFQAQAQIVTIQNECEALFQPYSSIN